MFSRQEASIESSNTALPVYLSWLRASLSSSGSSCKASTEAVSGLDSARTRSPMPTAVLIADTVTKRETRSRVRTAGAILPRQEPQLHWMTKCLDFGLEEACNHLTASLPPALGPHKHLRLHPRCPQTRLTCHIHLTRLGEVLGMARGPRCRLARHPARDRITR
jgi:hypothetical protein